MQSDDDQNGERLPRAGERIAGKYVVERVLKRGGMGVVLAARHAELAQPVAIKVLLPELAGDASMVARFLREGRAVSALRSDHVVRVHDVGRLEGGTPYLVMEMLHGSDLDRRVRKQGPLAWQEAVGYVMQVCEALVEAHALGIVHRDLKPSNLFLVDLPSGVTTVKVLDFGISKTNGLDAAMHEGHAITTTEAVLGSPTFMAPEQLKSAKYVDARADIWSLGLVLYFLITGKLAFDAETLGAYLVKILQEEPIPVRSVRADIPEELAVIIHHCLEKDPDRRFQSAVDLRAALAPFAPFAAHTSGLYAAARVTGNFAVPPLPHFTGLSPSAPTPAGGLLGGPTPAGPYGPSASTPAGMFGPSMATPAAYQAAPPAITPAGGGPKSSGSYAAAVPSSGASSSQPAPMSSPGAGNSDAPSVPPGLGSPTTQASWTSVGRRSTSGLRWAVIACALAIAGLVTVALWPSPQGPIAHGAGAPTDVPTASVTSAASAAPSTSATEPAPASASASASAAPSVSPTASASANGTATAAASPVGASSKAGSGPATSGTARTKTLGPKHISGPMETDL
jgi:serine/threonine-protein kinase